METYDERLTTRMASETARAGAAAAPDSIAAAHLLDGYPPLAKGGPVSADGADWHDPFADDEAALERERRRAEREARRRGVQASLGDKVSGEAPGVTTPERDPRRSRRPPCGVADPARRRRRPPTRRRPQRAEDRRRNHPAQRPSPPAADIGGLLIGGVAAAGRIFGIVKVIDRIDGGGDSSRELVVPKPTSEITIPEGLDRHQIAELVKKAGIKGDYLKATKEPPKKLRLRPRQSTTPPTPPTSRGSCFRTPGMTCRSRPPSATSSIASSPTSSSGSRAST